MTARYNALLYILVLLFGVSCNVSESILSSFQPQAPEKTTSLPRRLTTVETNIIASTNEFGLDLFKEVIREKPDENIIISPLSVYYALGITFNGAGGSTESAFRSVLNFGSINYEEINTSFKNLTDMLLTLDPLVQLSIANSVWYQLDYPVKQSFFEIAQKYFSAEVQGVNFGDIESKRIMNKWIKIKTNGKIEKTIEEVLIDDDVLYVINAIYFYGNWVTQFDPSSTNNGIFYLEDGNEKYIKMMQTESDFFYGDFSDVSVIDLPYGGGAYSMTIILPNSGKSINAVINNFSKPAISEWIQNLSKHSIYLSMPKFKIEFGLNLNKALINLGMIEVFKSGYFPKLFEEEHAKKIVDVIHKAYVDVNEKGTEAAAVTVVILTEGSRPMFIVNRPFLFLIRERFSNTILFIGKVVDPVY